MLIPMPSPTGRNNARLFAHGAVARALGAAYDSRSGLAYGSRRSARDQDDPPPPDDTGSMHGQDPDAGLAQIKTFLRNRLDSDSWEQLCAMLAALNGGGEDPDDGGQDEPQPFRGRPSGGSVNWGENGEPNPLPRGEGKDRRFAQDSRSGGGYFANFPSNAKVTFGYGS